MSLRNFWAGFEKRAAAANKPELLGTSHDDKFFYDKHDMSWAEAKKFTKHPENMPESLRKRQTRYYVSNKAGELQGFAVITHMDGPNKDTVCLQSLHVKPHARKQGLGSILMNLVREHNDSKFVVLKSEPQYDKNYPKEKLLDFYRSQPGAFPIQHEFFDTGLSPYAKLKKED
jgi:GNAT superfamily N-acetyltransferase